VLLAATYYKAKGLQDRRRRQELSGLRRIPLDDDWNNLLFREARQRPDLTKPETG